jgi:hypothetical protein
MGCSCPLSSSCNGFCTFPVSGELNICKGLTWNKAGEISYQILSGNNSEYSYQLTADSNI